MNPEAPPETAVPVPTDEEGEPLATSVGPEHAAFAEPRHPTPEPEPEPAAGKERNPAHYDPPPFTPWTIDMHSVVIHYMPVPDGAMVMVLTPAVQQPPPQGGVMMMPPSIRIMFDRKGWENFQAEVARDGRKSRIIPAVQMPPVAPR